MVGKAGVGETTTMVEQTDSGVKTAGVKVEADEGRNALASGKDEEQQLAYEKERQAIMDQNRQRMLELGLLNLASSFNRQRVPRTPKPKASPVAVRRSTRKRTVPVSYCLSPRIIHHRRKKTVSYKPWCRSCKALQGQFCGDCLFKRMKSIDSDSESEQVLQEYLTTNANMEVLPVNPDHLPLSQVTGLIETGLLGDYMKRYLASKGSAEDQRIARLERVNRRQKFRH